MGTTTGNDSDGTDDAAPAQTPARPASDSDGGPLTQLIHAFSSDASGPFGRIRQMLMVALGIGFLTAAGFVGATWRSRHAHDAIDRDDSATPED
ncbi:hypothetical protein M3F59_13455 [Brachybacterium muris]|uniref:Uncharacterized protein n=1 Tax=Brachybacterium muris UCD-AY4 TaxID=1249481 RepID=A0A022L1J8_9MICO|nr:hypothetical protein [Brachybacterium muris]EYT49676.1 hypothetical protein D641_0107240 [Brachybacterium muris UCD-AY4]MCT2262609.1 hypothetical protein [Brachybacterium muris]